MVAMTRCHFEANAGGWGTDGGGIQLHHDLSMVDCTVVGNVSDSGAGFVNAGVVELRGCHFEGNSAGQKGAAVSHGTVIAHDCVFVDNSASSGGAVGLTNADSLFVDCVFEGNLAQRGGAVDGEGTFQRCVFRDNSAGEGSAILSPDGALQLEDTRICDCGPSPVVGEWTNLGGNCIQEFCQRCDCPADWDMNGEANTADFIAYLDDWAAGRGDADINADGTIDTRDFLTFLAAWTVGC